MDAAPGGNDTESAAAKALAGGGTAVHVASWVPLEPVGAGFVARSLTFSFARRRPDPFRNPFPPDPPAWAETFWKAKGVSRFPGLVPDVLVPLGLSWPYEVPEQNAAYLRGRYYQVALHDYEKALKWYWRANELSMQVSIARPRTSFGMSGIVECLDSLGRKREADEIRRAYGGVRK